MKKLTILLLIILSFAVQAQTINTGDGKIHIKDIGQMPVSTFESLPTCDAAHDGKIFRVTNRNRDHYRCNGSAGFWVSVNGGVANVKDFGAVGDGATDDTAAFQSWANCGTKSKFLPPPTVSYKITQKVSFEADSDVFGVGEASFIDASLASFTGDTVFANEGTITSITTLSADVTQGQFSITLTDASAVNVDDILVIQNPTDYSWSGHRAYYRAGEMVRVRAKSGNVLGLSTPLYSNYLAADVTISRITPRSGTFRSFKVKLNPSASGLVAVRFSAVTKGILDNVSGINADYAAMVVSRSFNVRANGCDTTEKGTLNGNNYGIAVSSSQQVALTGSFYAQRHGVALGNESTGISIPSRNIRIRNAIVGGYGGEVLGADMHGSIEDVWYENCTLPTGLIVSGRNVGARNCYIHAGDGISHGFGPAVVASEVQSGFIKFENCHFISGGGNPVGVYDLLDFGHNGDFTTASTRGDVTVAFSNCTIDAQGITADALISFYANGSSYKSNLVVDGLTLLNHTGDRVVTLGGAGSVGGYLRVEGVSGIPDGAWLVLIASGSLWTTSPMRIQSQSGFYSITVTTADSVVVGGTQNLKWQYPRAPKLFFQNPATAGVYGQMYTYTALPASIRGTVFNRASGNFASDVTFLVPYRVAIEDF